MNHQLTDLIPHQSPTSDLAVRLADYSHRARGAFAQNTERAVASDLRVFSGWCMAAGVESCPADPADVARFLDEMAATRKVATVRRYSSSIGHLHRAAGLPSPTTSSEVRLALRRIGRAAAEVAQAEGRPVSEQAEGLSALDVAAIRATTGSTLRNLRDVALLLVGRDALARREELVALRVSALSWNSDGTATVEIIRSKTDASGEGATQYLGPDASAALRRWLDASGIADGPVFRSLKKGGKVTDRALDAGEIPALLRRLAIGAGLSSDRVRRVSGHSLRVGMAVDLVASGASLPEIMQAGRWSSPTMPARYTRRVEASRGAVARYYVRA